MSVRRFQASIRDAVSRSTQGERAASVSKNEMKDALAEMGSTISQAELREAKDLYDNGALTGGAKSELKAFLMQHGALAGAPPSTPGAAANGRELRKMLEENGTLRDTVYAAVFGSTSFPGFAVSLESVRKRDNGNFDVTLARHELLGLGHTVHKKIEVDAQGAVVGQPRDASAPRHSTPSAPPAPTTPPPPPNTSGPAATGHELRSRFEADAALLNAVYDAAFGQRFGHNAYALQSVTKTADGFDVEVSRFALLNNLDPGETKTVKVDAFGAPR